MGPLAAIQLDSPLVSSFKPQLPYLEIGDNSCMHWFVKISMS